MHYSLYCSEPSLILLNLNGSLVGSSLNCFGAQLLSNGLTQTTSPLSNQPMTSCRLLAAFVALNQTLAENMLSIFLTAFAIGLITVFDAILTGRQSGQKLQCLYDNPIANNFFQN